LYISFVRTKIVMQSLHESDAMV